MACACRIRPGQELVEALRSLARANNLLAAAVIACVGSADYVCLRLASATSGQPEPLIQLHGPVEILSLSGTLTADGHHLHASIADERGRVVGGHLVRLRVRTTVEVVLGECATYEFLRQPDEETGYNELVVVPRQVQQQQQQSSSSLLERSGLFAY